MLAAEQEAIERSGRDLCENVHFVRQREIVPADFSGNPGVIGRTIQLNGHPFVIIGVTQPDFAQLSPVIKPDVFTTMGTANITRPTLTLANRSHQTFQIVGRLRSGVTRESAERELEGLARQIAADHPDDIKRGVDLFPFSSMPTDSLREIGVFLSLLMGFGALILFVACGNVASMLLARGIQRRRELAIRTALGAARTQIVLHLMTAPQVTTIKKRRRFCSCQQSSLHWRCCSSW